MFKSARWRSEKNKVKVVFKLQFRATKVPPVGDDALMISVVPADVGKPTVKSDKAVVRDGSCLWEFPVYETVKLNQEPKSGKIHERIYYFVVGTGSSKAGVIGEASLDFANYAEANKVSLLSLPLKNSKTDTVLHVSIQRMQDSIDQREVEENESAKLNYKDHSLRSQLANSDADGTLKSNSDDVPFNNKPVPPISELHINRRASSESDVTMSSFDSGSGVEIPWQPLGNPALEASTDDSSTPRETFLSQRLEEEASDIVIEKLKSELAALSRQAEMSELELQTLRKQIVKESKRGQDLFKEVVCLKEERDALKVECEKAKTKTNFPFEAGDSRAIVEELRQELNHAKELNANLQIQLKKTQESNSELILAVQDLDEMLEQKNREILNLSSGSLTKMDIDEKSRKVGPTYQSDDSNDDEEQKALEEIVKEHGDAKEAYLLEQQIMDMRSEIEIYKRDKDELEMQMEQLALDYEIMKQENHEMAYKLEQSQIQEQLKVQYECTSSYANAQELESQIENLENELKRQTKESEDALVRIKKLEGHVKSLEEELEKQSQGFKSQTENLENELKRQTKDSEDALVRTSELEAHVKSLEEELEKQSQGFEADLEAVMCSKVEQEQRAIKAEETLRKTRWQNANTAERLQEEFRRLSVQMASTFEANEKLATKALAEANEFRLQRAHLEEKIKAASEEHESVKAHCEARLNQLSSQVEFMTNQTEQLENEKKHAEVTQRLLSDEIAKLKDEIETCMAKNKILSEEIESKETLMHELDEMRMSVKEMELLMEEGNAERIDLENKVMLAKNEAEESQKELNKMRCIVAGKEFIVGNLQSELDSLQSQYTELKNCLLEDELEKEKLKKHVSLLKNDLKKREDALKATSKTSKAVARGSKEVANLKERIRLLEGQIKLKESALEASSNTFLEKEKDLHNKIEELEGRLEVLNQSSIRYCENEVEKSRNEMALLKERNKLMEEELKEMQERYSEISLKFAEVEGERQQLVMKVRNLKNAKKRSNPPPST